MLRLTLLGLFITYFSLYALKDWYKSLCVLIAFVAIIEHPDVPKTILGIQGLNPWNLLLFFVLFGFSIRKKEFDSNTWDYPGNIRFLLTIYISFCLIAYFRMSSDLSQVIEWSYIRGEDPPSKLGLLSEHVINVIKWVIPSLILFYGCNSHKRFIWGLASALSIYFVLALLTIKAMPIGALADAERLEYLARKLLSDNVGYHRVNLAMMFAGAFWAVFSTRELVANKSNAKYIFLLCLIILYSLALSGGRTGYATWGVIGFIFAAIKWRRFLIYGPVLVSLIILLVPAARDRLMMGFDSESVDSRNSALVEEGLVRDTGNENVDLYTVTSGRTIAWPFVIDKIYERPILGYGKDAMIREGITSFLWLNYEEAFPHPHNMYLQWLFDNGIIAFIPVILFYLTLLKYSYSLFRDNRNKSFVAIGGASLALISALLIAGMGSQTFYPREGAVGMWCVIGLLLRVYMQRERVLKKRLEDNKDLTAEIPTDELWFQETNTSSNRFSNIA